MLKKSDEKQAAKDAKAADREKEAWLASPIGQATVAKEEGQGFFEIQLEVGRSQRDVIFGSKDFGTAKTTSQAGLLSAIEAVGWRLEHVGYFFVVTGESSRDKFLASGQSTAVSGVSMGVYLFRNAS